MRFPRGFFDGVTPAVGPGMHTDEASSALEHLAVEGLPMRDVRFLHDVSVGDEPRENPTEDANVVVAPYRELFAPAMLITGQWGPEKSELRRALPVFGARENPAYDVRNHAPFFERMEKLDETLSASLDRIRERYARNGVTDPKKQGWRTTFETLRSAVRYVLGQKALPPRERSIVSKDAWFLGLRKNAWKPLAGKGNQKLPFVAYSELPMVTCPGAGACGVSLGAYDTIVRDVVVRGPDGKPIIVEGKIQTKSVTDRAGPRGWCYSFTAWRYPSSYARQFLNTLANYADREFHILSNGGPADPRKHDERVAAAVRSERVWTTSIAEMALKLTTKARRTKPAFVRLFVDGDINTEDQIVAWMQACKLMGKPTDGGHGIEVYGYSKCWNQFLNVDKAYGSAWWPKNYVVNLSSGSVYASEKFAEVRTRMEKLPISRGYFEAVDLDGYLKQLDAQTKLLEANPAGVVPMPKPKVAFEQFQFSPERIEMFVRLNGVRTWEQARKLVPSLTETKGASPEQIRKKAYHGWLAQLLREPAFGAMVRREMARDAKPSIEAKELAAIEAGYRARLTRMLTTGEALEDEESAKDLETKALAIVLHEALWTYGLGGSCPLVCGNCSDNPKDASLGVHRCASKSGSPLWHATIHIGLH